MAGWSWIVRQTPNIKNVTNKKAINNETGLKMVSNRRRTDMDLKPNKNGGIPRALDDFRISNIGKSIKAIIAEYNHTIIKNAPFSSTYEGWALIRQKVDQLWEEIKKDRTEGSREIMIKEAAQIGAMAMRFIIDLGVDGRVTQMDRMVDEKKSNVEHFLEF